MQKQLLKGELISTIENLENRIKEIKDPNNIHEPIQDGIVNIQNYLSSKVRVMWVLKEANSPDDSDWDQRHAINGLRTESGILKGWKSTFEPIIYVTNGIINNQEWDEMPDIEDDYSIIDILKDIAYINVKKIPGGGNAIDKEIYEYFEKYKDILIDQIDLFQPQIVIFGNTMKYFKSALNLNVSIYDDSVHYAIYQNKLFIDAYHPSYVSRGIKGDKYFNSIKKVAKMFLDDEI